ncbi:hypothetical protein [Propionimicrobium lymphophilum]|uniref:hypothetical protein n=1 Tax=Propionimicrobium lymphophilum TaxID=33012 RepID=UPI0004275DB9|nr:hypothetical protein [Propionimicrobium lymphophilum]
MGNQIQIFTSQHHPLYLVQREIQARLLLHSPAVTEQQIKDAFVQALTERVNNNAVLDDAMQLLDDTVYNVTELEARHTARIKETVALMNQLITENASVARDPNEYDTRWRQLEQRYQQQEQEHHTISYQIADLTTRRSPRLPSNPATTRIQRPSVERVSQIPDG